MLIALYDKEVSVLSDIHFHIGKHRRTTEPSLMLKHFVTSSQLLEALSEDGEYVAVFVNANHESDQEYVLAKKIKECKSQLAIIFITSSYESVMKAYSIPAFRCLLKPISHCQLDECIESIIQEYYMGKLMVNMHVLGHSGRIYAKEIYFITAIGDISIIHHSLNSLEVKKSLDVLQSIFEPYHFIRIQKGFLVNASHILKISNYKVLLSTGISLAVSRKKYSEIRERYEKYKKYYSLVQ